MKEIIIIGAGASGLACAMVLNERIKKNSLGIHLKILEANDKIGKKILASGNGRCNLSNLALNTNDYYYDPCFNLNEILDAYDYHHFFDDHGLWTKNEGNLVYPNSKQASSVVDFFMKELENIEIITNQKVIQIDSKINQVITSDHKSYHYDYLVLATGSLSASKLGGNDSGYKMMKQLNHHITDLRPALVQMKSKQVKKYMKGTRIRGTFSLVRNKQIIVQEKGELLFTDYGLSGIAIFQLSRFYQSGDYILVDVFNEYTKNQLKNKLKSLLSKNRLNLEMILPKAYGRYLSERIGTISFQTIDNLVLELKEHQFRIEGLNDFENSQITRGGIDLKDINQDLSSKKVHNLYVCGEVLDIDGPCGGYNLHFAFSSGCYVANHIIQKEMGEL